MKLIGKTIFWTAFSCIIGWIALAVLLNAIPLEFADADWEDGYFRFRLMGFPIAILLTLFGTLSPRDTISLIIGKIIVTVVAAILSMFVLFFTAFNFCDTTTRATLFVHRDNPNLSIVHREFGCGAVDSGPPIDHTVKVRNVTGLFIYTADIDTNTIDESVWARVND